MSENKHNNISSKGHVPGKGKILISEPFLQDNIFSRSVIYIADYSEEGSIGLVLNKAFPLTVNDIVKPLEKAQSIPLYCGGPVGNDVLLYLHNLDFIDNSIDAGNGLRLNGNFEQIKDYILNGGKIEGHIRFFIGYSGWDKHQLVNEIKEHTWIVSSCPIEKTMNSQSSEMWSDLLSDMGGIYKIWAHFPIFPSLN